MIPGKKEGPRGLVQSFSMTARGPVTEHRRGSGESQVQC